MILQDPFVNTSTVSQWCIPIYMCVFYRWEKGGNKFQSWGHTRGPDNNLHSVINSGLSLILLLALTTQTQETSTQLINSVKHWL